eukprot:TRINITY_DN19221_c0_g1_i2.p1 TRINITY_DN19221_c0_g1~~TRINITY_DN19221_c0_g1_i2.p1  ORF type:complete len:219 (+),score=37.03 TRINITY_DN19221_c0_g1_i2:114-770(+)
MPRPVTPLALMLPLLLYVLTGGPRETEATPSPSSSATTTLFSSRNCDLGAAYQACCNAINTYWTNHRILYMRHVDYANVTPMSKAQLVEYAQIGSKQTLLTRRIKDLKAQCVQANRTRAASRYCWSQELDTGVSYNLPVAVCGPLSGCTEEEMRVVFLTWLDCPNLYNSDLNHCYYVDRWQCSTTSAIATTTAAGHVAAPVFSLYALLGLLLVLMITC